MSRLLNEIVRKWPVRVMAHVFGKVKPINQHGHFSLCSHMRLRKKKTRERERERAGRMGYIFVCLFLLSPLFAPLLVDGASRIIEFMRI